MKCISKKKLAIFLTLTSIFTSIGYSIDLKASNFKDANVISFKFDGDIYYGVKASFDKNKVESQVESNQLLDLTAKKNLSNYLNKKNKKNYEYILKEFQKSSDCSDSTKTCYTYFIKENNIEKKDIVIHEKTFDDYLKEHAATLKQGLDFLDFKNKEYIVSTSFVDLQNVDSTARINLIKNSNKEAEKNLLDFINDPSIYTPATSEEIIHNFSKLELKNKDSYTAIRYAPL